MILVTARISYVERYLHLRNDNTPPREIESRRRFSCDFSGLIRLAGIHAGMHTRVHAHKIQVEVGLTPTVHCSHSVRTFLLF